MVHSSSARHVDLAAAAALAAGTAKRMSFAPMVISTGCLMAYEALWLLMGRRSRTDCRGWFLNAFAGPHRTAVAGAGRRRKASGRARLHDQVAEGARHDPRRDPGPAGRFRGGGVWRPMSRPCSCAASAAR